VYVITARNIFIWMSDLNLFLFSAGVWTGCTEASPKGTVRAVKSHCGKNKCTEASKWGGKILSM